ncbi:GyrI-like domain-containing protein [Phytoactinopolyspora halotolerans]|uniref:GyrI-like domain-containing protein n=1 Tax=Phytoactinopolyspora halotolerans TaxID=1981512 RepID=A0A6L9S8F9_9ACTN|nr:GyrI-like domain-containing protein [Phytoactinopolyspora halotolerans]NEE01496.1 GyrI-like domain-containing protein [Phytoactinopolyspora halotolerans]
MPTVPTVIERTEQPYVGITHVVTMETMPEVADRLPEVFAWLAARGVAPAGSPFFRYNRIDMAADLEVEVGVPVEAAVAGDDTVTAGTLPGGRYATVTHVGHPDGLMGATGELLTWGNQQGLQWDRSDTPHGELWGCRLEIYHTDPAEEPDMNKWETDLAFKLAG